MAQDIRRLLDAACLRGLEWASMRRVHSANRLYVAKDGVFDQALVYDDEGYMVEVMADGQIGYAGFASSEPGAVRAAVERALRLARSAAGLALHRFDLGVRPPTRLRFESPRKTSAAYGADYIMDNLVALCGAMKISDNILQTSAEVETRDITTEYVSTSGADSVQKIHIIGYNSVAVARDGSIVQKRTLNGPRGRTRQGGVELLDFPAIKIEAARAAEQALALLAAPDCPTMTADLVLAPDQMMLQIHESVGHPLELDRILGDERNFAGSTFVTLEDIGSLRYGSDLMNITFDPTIEGEAACYAADDIGAPARKEYLIKDGILVQALGSLESQARSGKPGVANQRAEDWYRAPIDRMANLNLEPGRDSFDSIIGSIEKGIWMESNRSWSIDDYRNKFQFGCEYGCLIEEGRLTTLVRNPNYRGISSSFWRSLFKLGDESTFAVFGTPNCGKGEPGQSMTVGHASPVTAFKDVAIFGGES